MKKKVLSVMMAAALAVGMMAGCGSSSDASSDAAATEATAADETVADSTEKTTTGGSGYSVGINCFGTSSYALLTLANNSELILESYGDNVTVSDDSFQVDKIVQDIENMISAGVDGLAIWLPADSLYEPVVDICNDNEIPFY